MHSSACPYELQKRVQQRTGWRIRNLVIEMDADGATLHGRASTYYARQLAQHVLSELLPEVEVKNAIDVDHETEFLLGVPFN